MDLSQIRRDVKGESISFYGEQIEAERIASLRVWTWLDTHARTVASYEIVTDVLPRNYPKDFPMGNGRGWRVFPMLRKAAELVKRDRLDRFIYAKSPENIRSPGQEGRDKFYHDWWNQHVPSATFEKPLLDAWQGRPHAIQALPKELRALTIGCNRASVVNGEPVVCGKCDKCSLSAEAEKLLTAGSDPDTALDYLLRLRHAGPYIDFLIPGDKRFGADLPAPSPTMVS
jgi:hypothetical protein